MRWKAEGSEKGAVDIKVLGSHKLTPQLLEGLEFRCQAKLLGKTLNTPGRG